MLRNTAYYYFLKQITPLPIRLAVRRTWAGFKHRSHAATWPIDEKAGITPHGWPGWPDGKQFALVLTHDVEGIRGLNRVLRLRDLEVKYGFRSAFNFVPEGEYRLTDELRQELTNTGFEVGVHGLRHDGKLYSSKAGFAAKSAKIKSYLNKWNGTGFRSPLMQHRLTWLHQLGIEYDESTFDTDPFEPEPDGVTTIFPFWVQGHGGEGYVELPYSLPQDHTLFTILGEQNIDIWKRKLDWIAQRGGMALLNTHPDYMHFGDASKGRDEFPASWYEEFLAYVREKYKGKYWEAKPRDVSRYYRASLPLSRRNSRKKICMVAYTQYEYDNRVRRYAEALAKRGDLVEVIALGDGKTALASEEISGVTLHRIQNRVHNERHKWAYAWRLTRFLLASALFLARRHHRVRFDLVHVHNIPDFLVFAAFYPKLTGAKVILDIHDIVPELFESKFKTRVGDWYVRLLKIVEKSCASFADHVIVANHLWQGKLLARSVSKEKCSVVLNHVDEGIFYQRNRTRQDEKIIILFPGSFQWHQGLDVAVRAMARLKERLPNAELHLYGGGRDGREVELARFARHLGLNGSVKFMGGKPLDEIAEVIANADVGIVPKRADSFGNEAYSTKIMEFMSQGVPVVVSRTKIDSFYFDDGQVRFFDSGDDLAMAEAILEVVQNKDLRRSLVANGYKYVKQNGWAQKRQEYLGLVDSLTVECFDHPASARLPDGNNVAL